MNAGDYQQSEGANGLASSDKGSLEEEQLAEQTKKHKVIQSFVMYFGFYVLGVAGAIMGPTLLDLEITSRSNTETMVYVFTARSVGGIIGAVVSGVTQARINPWIQMSFAMFVGGVALVAMPLCRPVSVLMIVVALYGITAGLFDAGGNVTLLEIWGKDHGPWMQALHCIFGLGSWFGPLLAEPFLAKLDDSTSITLPPNLTDNTGTINHSEAWNKTGYLEEGQESETRIIYAYLIAGSTNFVVSFVMVIVYLLLTNRKILRKKTQKTENNEEFRQNGLAGWLRVQLLLAVFFFVVSYCVLEINYGNYLLTYTVKALHWDKSMSAAVTSGFWGSFTLSRALGIVLVKYIRPQVLMFWDCILSAISLAPILFAGGAHVAVVWVSSLSFGFGMGTIFGLAITWTESYVRVTGMVGSMFMIAGACGELFGPALIGLLYKFTGPFSIMYVMFSCAVLNLVLFIVMQLIAWRAVRISSSYPVKECGVEMNVLNAGNTDTLHNNDIPEALSTNEKDLRQAFLDDN